MFTVFVCDKNTRKKVVLFVNFLFCRREKKSSGTFVSELPKLLLSQYIVHKLIQFCPSLPMSIFGFCHQVSRDSSSPRLESRGIHKPTGHNFRLSFYTSIDYFWPFLTISKHFLAIFYDFCWTLSLWMPPLVSTFPFFCIRHYG